MEESGEGLPTGVCSRRYPPFRPRHKLQRLPEAVEAIQKAIAIDGREVLYHTSLSTVYRDMGMIPQAEDEMAISLQLQRGY